MADAFSQTARLGRLTTVLGENTLVLLRIDGTDYLSALFDYTVECLSEKHDLAFDDLLGTHATVTLTDHEGSEQHFDGIVTEVRWQGASENGYRYRLQLRPWLHLASLRRNQRIFHNMTVVEIIGEVLNAYANAGPLRQDLINTYPELEYTVQYKESDFAFVSRMMERHGISYRFEHDMGKHTMVTTDMAVSHPSIGERPFKRVDGHHHQEIEHFWEWHPASRVKTGSIRLTDYNFKTPTATMEASAEGDAVHEQGKIESYDWPGDYLDLERGQVVAQLRVDGERGQDQRYRAFGDIQGLRSGVLVTLSGDEVPGTGEEYICLQATHTFVSNSYGTGGPSSDDYACTARYVMMPSTVPMLPELKTERADVKGPQTATVVGAEGEEIDCDEYGRILVHFHWDLEAAYSMRCRVSQNWASNTWGGMVIPRIGMEVLVEFLDGDPDKPLVTGCVFNGKNAVPYPLPDHKTKSVFRSNSHKSDGHNELSFEDATGAENIALHAQKDQTLKVLNNRMKRVDNDQVESVGTNKSIEVGNNHQERIGGSMNLTVGGGKAGLFGGTAALLSQATGDALNVSNEAGNAAIGAFLGGIVAQTVGGEVASNPKISDFDAAGDHYEVAGANQIKTGTALGSVLSSIMPMAGVMNTVIEKFQSDTIGLARTEQIGLFKNTLVGAVQNTFIGSKQFTKVGQEQRLQVGKIKTVEVGEEYTTAANKRSAHSSGKLFEIQTEEQFTGTAKKWEIKTSDTLLLTAPGGYIEISRSGVKIRGNKVEVFGNAIDFKPGGGGEGSKCLRAMAASATPFVK